MAKQQSRSGPPQTGKGRASRIPLDYFKSLNGLEKAKLVATGVAVALAVAWLVWGVAAQPGGGSTRFARGPVAAVHASIESDCAQCHVSFSPMSEQNFFMAHPSRADGKCQTCHTGHEHHTDVLNPSSVTSCAACHRDHQGRDFSLVTVGDKNCVACHHDLKSHARGEVNFANAVKDFPAHPEFGTYLHGIKDPGALKFNHKLHLTPGQNSGYTLGRVKDGDAAMYTRLKGSRTQKADTDLVQLECASCHVPKTAGVGDPKNAGRYMQPVNYDTNCKACHPLTFDSAVKDTSGKPLALPHGKPFADIKAMLLREYSTAIMLSPKEFRGWQPAPGLRPLPGRPPVLEERAAPKFDGEKLGDMATQRAAEAARYLQGKAGCAECHTIKDDVIVPVNVPEVWFKHARFNHAKHESKEFPGEIGCMQCHGGAPSSTVNTDVLLPGVKSCQKCHGPQRTEGDKIVGGARYDCTTCHDYHHGEQPAGNASLRRDPGLALEWRKK